MSQLAQETDFTIADRAGLTLRGYCQDRGSGPLGLFVHGFRSDCSGQKGTGLARHAMERGYSWLRFDLRGHGRSDGEFSDFRLSSMVTDLDAVLRHFSDRQVILVGSSMGAWLSVLAACNRPQQVAGLLLLAPGFNFIQLYFGGLSRSELEVWQRQGRRRFTSDYDASVYSLDYAVLADARAFDVLDRAVPLACPMVIMHGDQDQTAPLAVTQRFIRQSPALYKELQVLPGGDHRLSAFLPNICLTLDQLWQRVFPSPRQAP